MWKWEKKLVGNAVVGQSGGPTAAINATLAGVIMGVAANRDVIPTLFGMRYGIEGFLDGRMAVLNDLFDNEEQLDLLSKTPAAALGSCRRKLPDPELDAAFYEKLIACFKAQNISYFFYIGGNDSMDTVAKLTAYLAKSDYEMRGIGVPKTIDNDLVGTDHTPGFGSAAKYVAVTVQEYLRDCAVYQVPAVTVVEIMGRDAGWLTAASALPRLISGDGPDLVYLPERTFDPDAFIASVKDALTRRPNVLVTASEGIRFADGGYVGAGSQSGVKDVFGHQYLAGTGKVLESMIREKIGCKVRSVELSISQRCASHVASLTDLTESREIGLTAVEKAVSGISGQMIALVRKSDEPYSYKLISSDVCEIANRVKTVPDEFLNEEGNNVTDACLRYLFPLIQGEVEQTFRDGLPKHFRI
jgi:6-phosphofructokinase 1